MPSVWNWVQEQRANGTPEQQELAGRFADAMELHNVDNARCLAVLSECRALAERYNEPWWTMLCDHWRLQTMIFETRELDAAMDLAVRCAVETRKEKYRGFPQRVCLHEDLIHTYQKKDPIGYEAEIRDAIRYMENEVAEGAECRHCILGLRASLESELGNYQEAYATTMEAAGLADSERSTHYLSGALTDLCSILHRGIAELSPDAYQSIQGWSEGADQMIQQQERWGGPKPRKRAEVAMWQALALLGLGQTEEAKRRFQSALSFAAQTDALPAEGFFQAAIAYHELAGEPEKALAVIERQAAALADKGEVWAETRAAWERCRLRHAMGTLAEEDVSRAMEMTGRFKQPGRALAVLTGGAVTVSEEEVDAPSG